MRIQVWASFLTFLQLGILIVRYIAGMQSFAAKTGQNRRAHTHNAEKPERA
jgi:hypothetical protein